MNVIKLSSPRIIMFFIAFLYTVGISFDYDAKWTIRNNTDHYIHVFVNNNANLYIQPKDFFNIETESRNVEIEAFYSPGQQISGSVIRNYTAASSDERGCEGCPIAPDSRYSVNFNPEDFQ